MFSKRELEGYLLIDHRAGDGITAEMVKDIALDISFPIVPAGKIFESATILCHGCERQIILNPDRSRARAYCPTHDHYLCDECEDRRVRTGKCVAFKAFIYELFNQAERRGDK